MGNNNNKVRKSRYFKVFLFAMALNVLSAIVLSVNFAQTQKNDFSTQQRIKVEVTEQKNCPIRIVFVNVDDSNSSFQNISYSVQNIGDKSIRAFTFLGGSKSQGKVVTNTFATRLFQAGELRPDSLPIERQNIKEDETVFLSIDYVEFADGSSWGTDTQKKATYFEGERAGRTAAVKHFRDLLRNSDLTVLKNYLDQNITEIEVLVPDNEHGDWKNGFRIGYKTIFSNLQSIREQKHENFSKKLEEMERNIK